MYGKILEMLGMSENDKDWVKKSKKNFSEFSLLPRYLRCKNIGVFGNMAKNFRVGNIFWQNFYYPFLVSSSDISDISWLVSMCHTSDYCYKQQNIGL